MSMPMSVSLRIGAHLMKQKLRGNKRFPLIVELEPLFACNLKCAGCGKIQHPASVLKQRMPVEQAVAAIEECGAPMVSIAGGEPLMHPQLHVIVQELIKRKKFVFLCTNAVLLPKHIDKFTPSPYFRWVVHIDGLRERHDEAVSKEGVFDQAVAAIKLAKERGFKVNTNTTFFNTDTPQTVIDVLTFLNDELEVDDMQISPAYAYEKAPDQEHFLGVEETRELFRKAFSDGRRKKFVYLCTNAILLKRKIDQFTPSPYFSFVVHVDGLRERHDELVCRDGVFDDCVEAIKLAQSRGFRVTTNSTFFNTDTVKTVREVLDFLNDELEVDAMMVSPGYAYEKAPDQEHFLGVQQTQRLFRDSFADGRRKKWRLNHTPLFLDFLEGKQDYQCTAWGIPSYSVFGWQRPCYLMADGYTKTYRELVETTDWSKYGRGRDPRCANCMAHCGYEPTAVIATTKSLKESLRAAVSTR